MSYRDFVGKESHAEALRPERIATPQWSLYS
jgi:hypothetical protein